MYTYLDDELVKDKKKVGLVARESACDVLIVGWVEFLLRCLGQGAHQGIDEELEAFDLCLLLERGKLVCFQADNSFDFVLF